jgi:hypothetical protein
MIPTWLQAHIGDTWRTACLRTCTRCGAPILAGLDAPRAGLPVKADPTPLNSLGETVALLSGQTTYDLVTVAGRKELNYRDQITIAAPRRHPVLAAHKCGMSYTAFAEPMPIRPTAYSLPAEPPF